MRHTLAFFIFLAGGTVALVMFVLQGEGSPFVLHGALMMAAWCILAPLCALIARFLKVTADQDYPAVLDNPLWWRWHWIGQSVAIVLSTAGFVVAWRAKGGIGLDSWHTMLGMGIVCLGWLQMLGGLLRGSKGGPSDPRADPADPATWRGDHYDMTLRRHIFQWVHKSLGYAALIGGAVAASLGLEMIGAQPWITGMTTGVSVVFILAFGMGEILRWRMPTYHALWGEDERHPGNTRALPRNAAIRPDPRSAPLPSDAPRPPTPKSSSRSPR